MLSSPQVALVKQAIADEQLIAMRQALAAFAGETFAQVGDELLAVGSIFGGDRVAGKSPFGHGSDEIVAISMLLRIGSQLTTASADLFRDGRQYAAAALLRQLVEIEYLAWAFQTHDQDAERWLRSDAEERRKFFTPAKLRAAAQGKFRGQDYGYHCEFGGHPVPGAHILLKSEASYCSPTCWDMWGASGITSLAGPMEMTGPFLCIAGGKKCSRSSWLGRRPMRSHRYHHRRETANSSIASDVKNGYLHHQK